MAVLVLVPFFFLFLFFFLGVSYSLCTIFNEVK